MSRYSEAPQEVIDLINNVIDEHFSNLVNCNIKVLIDSKKRKSKGAYTFASIKKMNPKEKYLSADNFITEGYDYLMLIDGNIFNSVTEEDKIRIIRHELRHVYLDLDAKDPCKVVDHDVNDFMEEIKLNKDDPEWSYRVAHIAESIYEKD